MCIVWVMKCHSEDMQHLTPELWYGIRYISAVFLVRDLALLENTCWLCEMDSVG